MNKASLKEGLDSVGQAFKMAIYMTIFTVAALVIGSWFLPKPTESSSNSAQPLVQPTPASTPTPVSAPTQPRAEEEGLPAQAGDGTEIFFIFIAIALIAALSNLQKLAHKSG